MPLDYWKDRFQTANPSQYHQFKNKTPDKKDQMATAALYKARQPNNENFVAETAMMGKIEDSGKIIRILKKAHTVPFSDEKNWLLVDMDPAKGNSGLGIKWIPADTRFEWVRPYRDNVEQDVAEDTLNEFDYNKHVKMLNAYMKKLGYSYIGHGTDAHVFAKEAGLVTKVLIPKSGDISTAKNPFLAFLNYCKKNAGNPHLPKFTETTKEPIQLGSEKFDQVVMERLQEVDPKYEDLLVSITDSIEDGKPLDPQYQPYIKFYQTLKSVMLTGRKLGFENDIITFQSVNIMQRGNTLVIIDPWTGKGQQGVAEGATVTRIDSKPITDFGSSLKAYKHTDDWSQSGVDTGDDSYWKNKNLKTNTTKGLFAGDPRRTALYATGNAYETRYVEFTQNGQPIVYFDQKDLPAMRSRKTYLTVFDAGDFRQLPTGEWFSENPSKPIKQMPIGDPFKYIAGQGWIVRVTDDLGKVFKQVKNMHKAGKIAHYGAEGMNESKQGVAEGQGDQISKTKALSTLRKELMNSYEYMKSGNLTEFKQRLLWLSEGMLKNHITHVVNYVINMEEIELYQEYREKREQIQRGLTKGVAENFADGRNPQDKGDSKRHGVPTKSSVSNLRKVAKQGGRKGQLAHWMANMKAGKTKKK